MILIALNYINVLTVKMGLHLAVSPSEQYRTSIEYYSSSTECVLSLQLTRKFLRTETLNESILQYFTRCIFGEIL